MKSGRLFIGFGLGAALTALPASLAAQAAPAAAAKPPVMQHTLQGRQQCLMCHGGDMPNIVAAPKESHEGRTNEACAWCHAKDAAVQTATPPAVPHTLQGRDQCLMCHSGKMPNVKAPPAASHTGMESKHCKMCHVAAQS